MTTTLDLPAPIHNDATRRQFLIGGAALAALLAGCGGTDPAAPAGDGFPGHHRAQVRQHDHPGAEGEGAAGVNIEQMAALTPDLILAINDFGLELDYPKLSQIAPTVGYATKWGAQTWQEQVTVDARALGLEQRGRQVVAETEGPSARHGTRTLASPVG